MLSVQKPDFNIVKNDLFIGACPSANTSLVRLSARLSVRSTSRKQNELQIRNLYMRSHRTLVAYSYLGLTTVERVTTRVQLATGNFTLTVEYNGRKLTF
ncbi:hypothetical protein J6590_073627 [Homalodisca vitripennis]|nr:hypothetical protein J6590_073627 [Homalodisca vitripennis]